MKAVNFFNFARRFEIGSIHRDGIGFYVVESVMGGKVVCRYLDSGVQFSSRRSLLANIEYNFLGYILLSLEDSRKVLEQRGIDAEGWPDLEIVVEAAEILEKERKIEDRKKIQAIYQEQMLVSGKHSGTIRNSTRKRESGCHKCKSNPLISEILYECPLCYGMVCRSCGSCHCNSKKFGHSISL